MLRPYSEGKVELNNRKAWRPHHAYLLAEDSFWHHGNTSVAGLVLLVVLCVCNQLMCTSGFLEFVALLRMSWEALHVMVHRGLQKLSSHISHVVSVALVASTRYTCTRCQHMAPKTSIDFMSFNALYLDLLLLLLCNISLGCQFHILK